MLPCVLLLEVLVRPTGHLAQGRRSVEALLVEGLLLEGPRSVEALLVEDLLEEDLLDQGLLVAELLVGGPRVPSNLSRFKKTAC